MSRHRSFHFLIGSREKTAIVLAGRQIMFHAKAKKNKKNTYILKIWKLQYTLKPIIGHECCQAHFTASQLRWAPGPDATLNGISATENGGMQK